MFFELLTEGIYNNNEAENEVNSNHDCYYRCYDGWTQYVQNIIRIFGNEHISINSISRCGDG